MKEISDKKYVEEAIEDYHNYINECNEKKSVKHRALGKFDLTPKGYGIVGYQQFWNPLGLGILSTFFSNSWSRQFRLTRGMYGKGHTLINCAKLLREGKSCREIKRALNMHDITIRKLKYILEDRYGMKFLCGCGKDSWHNGWCEYRISKSPKRKKYIEGMKQHSNEIRPKIGDRIHCKNGHSWNEENIYTSNSGMKVCRRCRDESKRRHTERLGKIDSTKVTGREDVL